MDKDRLEQQLDFLLEIDGEKRVTRQNYNADGEKYENDAEHAWHMAVMAILLSEYANEPIDLLHTVKMILLHDVIEVDAGDTYAYDEERKKIQSERESAAAERIYGLLPDDQQKELTALWQEFEAQQTPEARFARTMDNLQPMMLNNASDGKSWVEHGVRLEQVLARNENSPRGSEELWNYAKENWLLPNVEKRNIKES